MPGRKSVARVRQGLEIDWVRSNATPMVVSDGTVVIVAELKDHTDEACGDDDSAARWQASP